MAILVTGAAGFIGSHLVDKLLSGGHEVVGLDNFSTGSRANLAPAAESYHRRLRVVDFDVRDPGLGSIIEDCRPRAVVHLAAQPNVRHSVEDPLDDAATNVMGTINVLEAVRRAGTSHVVFSSSGGCIYGEPHPSELPLKETHPFSPLSPYGTSKVAAEHYVHMYGALHGVRWTVLALANVYGPRQDPAGEAGVVAIFLQQLLADRPVTVYGDGEQTRDFVYVADVVDAFQRALDSPGRGRLNIGTGVPTSVNSLYQGVARVVGSDRAPVRLPGRRGELEHNVLDPTRARLELGWRAATPLDVGLRATAAATTGPAVRKVS